MTPKSKSRTYKHTIAKVVFGSKSSVQIGIDAGQKHANSLQTLYQYKFKHYLNI